ncbi:MAG: helix-hairpin-helix domain-containing protein, partial [Ruminococcus sp.]|nr:helix-hairpin-helix domain-containing protein [Ruminococcus sp.]
MPGKEAVIKTASLIAAAAMFITGAVLFYQHTESGSESSTKRTAIDSMSSIAASVTADEASSDTAAYPMDINKATLGDFMNVDGIGEVIAGRITAYRAEAGAIHDIA